MWCDENGKTTNRPFDKFPIEECLYGTPVYISLDEREQIWNADLSARPQLAIQRDIFIFQSVIGCRVSDLYRMTKQSIVNGAIEYIPKKTKEGRPLTVRVPLNERAKEILKRYEDFEGPGLLPFISEQKYNKAIKEFFKLAGIDRIVTTLDPLTREEVKRPIYEVASSHMARRTFICLPLPPQCAVPTCLPLPPQCGVGTALNNLAALAIDASIIALAGTRFPMPSASKAASNITFCRGGRHRGAVPTLPPIAPTMCRPYLSVTFTEKSKTQTLSQPFLATKREARLSIGTEILMRK